MRQRQAILHTSTHSVSLLSALRAASIGLALATSLTAGCDSQAATPSFTTTGGSTIATGGIGPVTGGLPNGTGGMETALTGGMDTATGGMDTATGGMDTATGGMQPATGGEVTGDGDCCPDGNCVCRGPEPSQDMLGKPGPFTVQKYTDGFPKGNKYLGATIYYPSDAEGPLSIIVLCPGFTATQDSAGSVGPWGPFLASHGFVTMTIDTLTTFDGVDVRDDALLDALSAVKGEHTRSGSPLEGKLSTTRFGVGGWSMGGGGTGIAAATDASLKTAMGLAAHYYTVPNYLMTFASKITVPTILFAGETDSPTLGGGGQNQDIYQAIPSTTPKILYEMTGLDHFQFGTPTTTNGGALGAYGLAFQKTFLEGDERYRKFLLMEGPNASDWRSNIQ